jgi:hypothetical protein
VKDELAERLLAKVMNWDAPEVATHVRNLQALATYKYDSYAGFRPGEKFMENLAVWLGQFDYEDRKNALRFVLENLVFMSRAEMDHAIEITYHEIIRPTILWRAAEELSLPPHMMRKAANTPVFRALERKVLVLGLADGAQLDRLRRSSPLSHEQFYLSPELGPEGIAGAVRALEVALKKLELPGPPLFRHVMLVDDFYGSGHTLIRKEGEAMKGKLVRARSHLDALIEQNALEPDAPVSVILYAASEQALAYIREQLESLGLRWELSCVQMIPNACKVTNPDILRICESFFDPILEDSHKGRAPYGYADARLPLVLHHNSPNNSVSIIWADTREVEGSAGRRALFPRYERHHRERP